ncbi:calcium and integrin-binding family member 3-like [Macrobrachium nipponense]|uniref:calcium and integrin-binding family member 3-like n=1 Tax=Macrobrachium nipponense TaxID=159736 RepID=UPI0030C8674B
MGNNKSVFTVEELQEYEELTYLTRKEIILAWKRWEDLVGKAGVRNKSTRYPEEAIQEMPELKYNPFKRRITYVFSSARDGRMGFDDFLDLLSVMSDKAPLQLKAFYAFHIFDYNGDHMLDDEDLEFVIDRLTGQEKLLPEEKKQLVDKLLKEVDLDGGGISQEEFKHLLTKCPDFIHSFRFTV